MAQSIERSLVATAGHSATTAGTVLVSSSIGEILPIVVETPSIHLTQGFQQGDLSPVLPVNLLRFEAWRINARYVHLDWDAEGDLLFKGFHVERRLENESDFKAIAWLDKQEQLSYDFKDANDFQGLSFYRLKMMDLDSTFEYSMIRVVDGMEKEGQTTVAIAPNPVTESCQLFFDGLTNETIHVTIANSLGTMVYQHQFASQDSISIAAFADFPKGVYYIQVYLNGEKKFIKKVLKK